MIAAHQAKTCFCNHCKQPLARRALDAHFLCEKCRVLPGVRGYRDPSKRGLESGSLAYWEDTKDQLRIVRDEGPPEAQRSASTATAAVAQPFKLREWQEAVFSAAELTAEVKVALIRLSYFADWSTGANCWPSYATLAKAIGRTEKQVRNLIGHGVRRGWISVESRRLKGRGKTSNLYHLRSPNDSAVEERSIETDCPPIG